MQNFDNTIPIYLQIIDRIKLKIISGEWPPGERIASVRELAMQFEVNPNTMQRALTELERDGLIFTERTSGKFVSKDKSSIEKVRNDVCNKYISDFLKKMKQAGYEKGEILERLNKPEGLK